MDAASRALLFEDDELDSNIPSDPQGLGRPLAISIGYVHTLLGLNTGHIRKDQASRADPFSVATAFATNLGGRAGGREPTQHFGTDRYSFAFPDESNDLRDGACLAVIPARDTGQAGTYEKRFLLWQPACPPVHTPVGSSHYYTLRLSLAMKYFRPGLRHGSTS